MTIAAGIVTYNPDLTRLSENLAAVLPQVDQVLVVDNASNNHRDLVRSLEGLGVSIKLDLLSNQANVGMARALNQVMTWAIKHGAEWVLLLDQDSVCSRDMVDLLRQHMASDVGIVAPLIADRNITVAATGGNAGAAEVDYCITSGSLCNTIAWRQAMGYDESMFIDFVDFDFCLRLRVIGFRIVRDPAAVLVHQIGDSRRHGRTTAYNHSAFRSYHMARDMLYYARKHLHSPSELRVRGRGLVATYLILFRKAFIVAVRETDRRRRIKAILTGMVDETFRLHDRTGTRSMGGPAQRSDPRR